MGPQAAINAVYYNQLQAIEDEAASAPRRTEELRRSMPRTSTSCTSPPSSSSTRSIEPEELRAELVRRFAHAASKRRDWPAKRNPVTPV